MLCCVYMNKHFFIQKIVLTSLLYHLHQSILSFYVCPNIKWSHCSLFSYRNLQNEKKNLSGGEFIKKKKILQLLFKKTNFFK
jgi:hypothetical protein